MSEKPILFSTPMVEAILEGRKSMTRRIIKEPIEEFENGIYVGKRGAILHRDKVTIAPWSIGDILWVRETWAQINWPDGTTARSDETVFRATPPDKYPYVIKWKPGIHLRHNQARIFLKVTNVRIERLNEITNLDAKAEGMIPTCDRTTEECRNAKKDGRGCNKSCEYFQESHLPCFRLTWNKLNKKRGFGWDKNPWVWVIVFDRVKP